jgi:hypothetical protein
MSTDRHRLYQKPLIHNRQDPVKDEAQAFGCSGNTVTVLGCNPWLQPD